MGAERERRCDQLPGRHRLSLNKCTKCTQRPRLSKGPPILSLVEPARLRTNNFFAKRARGQAAGVECAPCEYLACSPSRRKTCGSFPPVTSMSCSVPPPSASDVGTPGSSWNVVYRVPEFFAAHGEREKRVDLALLQNMGRKGCPHH